MSGLRAQVLERIGELEERKETNVQEGGAPDKPFPHLNDTDTFRKMIRRRLTFALAAPMAVLSLAGLVLLLRRRRRR